MKTIIYSAFAFLMSVMALTACSSDNVSGLALSGDCMVESFELDGTYTGVIDLSKRTIKVKVPVDFNGKSQMKITKLGISNGAQANMAVGMVADFSAAQSLHVTNGDLFLDWTVNVKNDEARITSFIINDTYKATKIEDLVGEEQEACKWMLANVEQSVFVSWGDMANMDLSKCEVIFWHWQHQPSENLTDFETGATSTAMAYRNKLLDYYKNGGAFILGRAAVNFAASLGAVKDKLCANNCWGASDDGGDIIKAGEEWSFLPNDASHPIWQNLVGGNDKIITTDGGYKISNCVSQWGAWSFDGFADWEAKTGCKALGHGGDGAVVVWEAPAYNGTFGKGGIICFGSGCYDWYSPNPYESYYHENVGIMTGNAFKYLSGK